LADFFFELFFEDFEEVFFDEADLEDLEALLPAFFLVAFLVAIVSSWFVK
jgi:hypothetical protein